MDLMEIIGQESLQEKKATAVSAEEIAVAEVEMAKIENELDKVITTEEFALNKAVMMQNMVEVVSNEEIVSEATLRVLEASLESVANIGNIDKELLVPSTEEATEKKDGMVAKMKTFIQNVIASFSAIYAKIMKYIVKWINKARIVLGRKVSEDDLKTLEGAKQTQLVKELDDKTNLNLLLLRLSGVDVDATSLVSEEKILAAAKGQLTKALFNGNKDEYKAAKNAKTLSDVGFEVVGSEITSSNKIVIGLKFKTPQNVDPKLVKANESTFKLFTGKKPANITHLVSISLSKKEVNEVVKKKLNGKFEFVKIDTTSLGFATNSEFVKGVIDEIFNSIKNVEKEFKAKIDEVKKAEGVTTEDILQIKLDYLTESKLYRQAMFIAVGSYKESVALTKTLIKWVANSKKEEEKKEEK